jgi:uncharacterized protein (TIGR00369 family)
MGKSRFAPGFVSIAVLLNEVSEFIASSYLVSSPARNRRRIEFGMPKKPHGRGHDTRYVRLRKNYCFACGRNNADGMRLKFVYDQAHDRFVCRFRLGKKYTGPPGHCHGGIIATVLDEAMGKVNKLRQVVALTTQITVDYLKPVPLNQPLRVESREVRVRGRRHVNSAEILNQKGKVLARSRGPFLAIDPKRMFGKFVEPPR